MLESNLSRRRVLSRLMVGIGWLTGSDRIWASTSTPKATEGPFYPEPSMRFDDADNDLVKIDSKVNEAGGEILQLSGSVLDKKGKPCPGARIEIWQCDVNGKYLHPGDNRQVDYDNGFQGFGHDITDQSGRYSFRTIVPTRYPGRTPHIHVKVIIDGKEKLTTQFYIQGHADNSRDSIYRRLSPEQASMVDMSLDKAGEAFTTSVNVVV